MANLYGYNTSSAYKLDYDFDSRKSDSEKLRSQQINRKPKKVVKKNPAKNLVTFLKVAVCFAVAFAIVNGYVKINEANGEVAKLEAEYNDIVASNQAIQMKIDKTVDLEKLQDVADQQFGMTRPERDQIFYIDMEQADFAETPSVKSGTTDQTPMKGVTGSLTGTLNIFN